VPPFSRVILDGADIGMVKILVHVSISLKRLLIGFAISTALALPAGFVLGGGLPIGQHYGE
jgi:NitT/TauT family transport system permease protein